MNIREPMTLATDYLLGAAALLFAARLARVSRMWALAFICTAIAAFAGGTHHGFVAILTPIAAVVLWKMTLLAVGFASFFLLAGTSRGFAVFAVVKLVVYATWMIAHDDFVWVIADYGITLLLVGVAFVVRWFRHRDPATPWIIGSIAVSIVAALIQQSGISLHRHFNHNDLYHLVQIAALWLLHRGGRIAFSTNRAITPLTIPPT